MKILAISAFHPPDHFGGFELRVKSILDGLAERGHEVILLTTLPQKKRLPPETSRYPVLRKLHNRMKAKFFPREVLEDLSDTRVLKKQLEDFQPDLVYIGHLYVLSKALLPYLAGMELPLYYDEGGSGLIDAWEDQGRWFRFTGDWRSRFPPLNWIKPLAVRLVCALSAGRLQQTWSVPLQLSVSFNSRLNLENARAAGVPLEDARVIHSGVDLAQFNFRERRSLQLPIRIIVPGRLERRKGQKDAILLLQELTRRNIDARVVLAGSSWSDGYDHEIAMFVKENDLFGKVQTLSMISQAQLAEEYHRSDFCFFPSMQKIGFSRTPLEAMACGCVVISYGNEGSDEIIRQGETGFLVDPGNINQAADVIETLMQKPRLLHEITTAARQGIENEFQIKTYIDRIEIELKKFDKQHG